LSGLAINVRVLSVLFIDPIPRLLAARLLLASIGEGPKLLRMLDERDMFPAAEAKNSFKNNVEKKSLGLEINGSRSGMCGEV